MACTLVSTTSGSIVNKPVKEALVASIERCGRAVLLVDTPDAKRTALKLLASDPMLSLGLCVVSLSEWAKELWNLFGDGRQVISKEARLLLIHEALDTFEAQELKPLDVGTGTLKAIETIARNYLPCINARDDALGFTVGQQRVLAVLERYLDLVHQHGMLEQSESYALLVEALPKAYYALQSVVVSGVENLSPAEEAFLSALAQTMDVHIILSTPDNYAGDANRAYLKRLSDKLRVDLVFVDDDSEKHDAEIEALLHTIFRPRQNVQKPQGKVVLLSPAGILAKSNLIVEHVQNLIAQGAQNIGIYAPYPNEAWEELAPRLAARGIFAKGCVRQLVAGSQAGRAFLSLVKTVLRLQRLSESWPDASQKSLGDMTWWPPRELTDFLLSPISQVSVEKAWSLDRSWRSNRTLMPHQVLRSLTQASHTSQACAEAVTAIRAGRIKEAVNRLLMGCAEHQDAYDAQTYYDISKSLSAVIAGTQTMRGLGMKFDVATEQRLYALMGQEQYELRLTNGVAKTSCAVEILSAQSSCEPNAFDAVICLGMDSVSTSLVAKDRALDVLTQKLTGVKAIAPLAESRRSFYKMLASARQFVSLELTLHDEHANEAFACVVLKELLACYGGSSQNPVIPQITRGEETLSANLLVSGKVPHKIASLPSQPTGCIPEVLKPFVLLPSRQGEERIQIQKLSASQIESYLECPYKWFTQKRLGLDGIDAGFGGIEKGIFVHRVLELTHRQLLREALGQADNLSVDQTWDIATTSLPLSRVSSDTLTRATQILDEQFDILAEEQYATSQKKSRRAQRLVPHSASQHQQMQKLREDLHGLLSFEADKLLSFEPRFFELKFGMDGGESAQYAGIEFNGSIDRIDVNAKGEAVIIDYKHKSSAALKDYAVQSTVDEQRDKDVVQLSSERLPRHVQAIIYAQVVRKYLKAHNLTSIGAMYMGTRHTYALLGAAPDSYIYRIFGVGDDKGVSKTMESCIVGENVETFNACLDAWEAQIAQAVERMLNGDIRACALDKEACTYCPVMNCLERKN